MLTANYFSQPETHVHQTVHDFIINYLPQLEFLKSELSFLFNFIILVIFQVTSLSRSMRFFLVSSSYINPNNGDMHNFLRRKYQFGQIFFVARLHTPSWSSGEHISLRTQGSCIRSSLETQRIKVRFDLTNPGVAGRCVDR